MRKGHIFLGSLVLLCTAIGIAEAVRPSGPGQTTSSASLSVVTASDHRVKVNEAPQAAESITPSDSADASTACTGSIYVGVPDAGTLTAYACGSDASVQFHGLAAGSRIPGCFRKVMATGTTAAGLVCQGF